ncbi:sphingosine kinase 1 [Hemicordylus capensis]|uniref:sphingosine kinase 1 n=1 Tax=Hemicordylus capensis TaxID=884348 RepID=UPI002302B40F|nr:sphingosine kinase 1 [Hemicordylus capensis]
MEGESGPGKEGAQPRASAGEVLLSGVFCLAPALKSHYALSLTRGAELLMRRQDSAPAGSPLSTALSLSDCIGCYVCQGKGAPQPAAAYFTVFCYPSSRKSWWDSGESRQRVAKTFCVLVSQEAQENRAIAETWATKIRELSAPRSPELEGGIHGLLPRPCHVMVLLNPQSGSGRALHLFTSQVQPMLTEANITFSMFVTEKHNHAWELMKEEDISRCNALVAMAGDGLLYEMINGLMERPDWESAIQKPLCILPGGSGNALAASLNHYASKGPVVKDELLMNCTYFLCKGLHSPMDLVSLCTASGKRLFSFLSFSWGFVSDVDIVSERYRKLGSARFTLGTFQLLTTLQVYKGRLSYLPAEEPSHTSGPLPSAEEQSSPPAQHAYQDCFSNENSVHILPQSVLPSSREGSVLKDSLLVPFDQPVPKHWIVAPEEEFISIVGIHQSHLGADLLLAPTAKLYDDAIHLFCVSAGVSRMAMIRFFMAMEKGTHLALNNPYLRYVPVKAFRLEPLEPKGFMTVDGEVLTCEPVQGQIHRQLAHIISGS